MTCFDQFDPFLGAPSFVNHISTEPGVRLHFRPGVVSFAASAVDFLMTLPKEVLVSEGLILSSHSSPGSMASFKKYPCFDSRAELVAALIRSVELVHASRYGIVRLSWDKAGTKQTTVELTDPQDRFLISFPKEHPLDLSSANLPKAPTLD